MPRFLTTNRTSGRAYWFPPGFQTPLHISFGFPSPASKGNIWGPFCFAVTTGTSEALQGDCRGAAQPGLTLGPRPLAHPTAAPRRWASRPSVASVHPKLRLSPERDGKTGKPPAPTLSVLDPSDPLCSQVPLAPTCLLRQDLRTHRLKCHGQVIDN